MYDTFDELVIAVGKTMQQEQLKSMPMMYAMRLTWNTRQREIDDLYEQIHELHLEAHKLRGEA